MLIGRPAIARNAWGPANKTNILNAALKATEAVTITKARVYVQSGTSNVYFGIFYLVSGTTFHCRSATGNLGNLASGYYEFDVNLPCQVDDMIGVYADDTSGYVHYSTGQGDGYYVISGANHCVVDDEASWTLVSGREASIEGEGGGAVGGQGGPAAVLVGLGTI